MDRMRFSTFRWVSVSHLQSAVRGICVSACEYRSLSTKVASALTGFARRHVNPNINVSDLRLIGALVDGEQRCTGYGRSGVGLVLHPVL